MVEKIGLGEEPAFGRNLCFVGGKKSNFGEMISGGKWFLAEQCKLRRNIGLGRILPGGRNVGFGRK